MPQFVRAGLRYPRWLETDGRRPLDFPADVLTDLRTAGDQLSVYEIVGPVTAERIATAVAAGKQKTGHTSYAVFEEAEVEGLRIGVSRAKRGSTFDEAVNAVHRDLQIGTVDRLLALAELLAAGEIVPIVRDRVTQLLKTGFESGQLDYRKNKLLCAQVKAQIPALPDEEQG